MCKPLDALVPLTRCPTKKSQTSSHSNSNISLVPVNTELGGINTELGGINTELGGITEDATEEECRMEIRSILTDGDALSHESKPLPPMIMKWSLAAPKVVFRSDGFIVAAFREPEDHTATTSSSTDPQGAPDRIPHPC